MGCFVDEFGHQLGLNHEGFWSVGASPIYTSLMNYTWSYGFEGDRNKIHYSDGRFARLVMHENDLDETLPYTYEQVKFLGMGPYHFKLKPAGKNTLIDWNWNGIFGEKHVKATVNYAYSTTAGVRDNVGKTKTAPWIFTHNKRAFVLFGTNDAPVDLKVQPTLSSNNPGRLVLRRLIKPTVWDPEWVLRPSGLIGDPVAVSFKGRILCAFPSQEGLTLAHIEVGEKAASLRDSVIVSPNPSLIPTIGSFEGRCYLFEWDPLTHEVGYWIVRSNGKIGDRHILDVPSSNPLSICEDPIAHQAVIGLAQDQDKGRTNRWQVRRYTADSLGVLKAVAPPEWVEGPDGGSRGDGANYRTVRRQSRRRPQGQSKTLLQRLNRRQNSLGLLLCGGTDC